MRLYAFNKILLSLLNSKIKFTRSKEQPLIPKQTLTQSNKFKSVLIQFIKHFGINLNVDSFGKWEGKKSTKLIMTLYMDALNEIEKLLLSSRFGEYPLFKEKVFISKLIDYTIFETKSSRKRTDIKTKPERRKISTSFRKHNIVKHHKSLIQPRNAGRNNLYSIMVPFHGNVMIKYKFISFNPLIVSKKIVHK